MVMEMVDTGMVEEEEEDLNWVFMRHIYELFLELVESPAVEAGMLKGMISVSFLTKYLDLFNSEEPRERELVKMILHKMYAKCVMRRKLIRRAFTNCFFEAIYEKPHFNGVNEILEINAAIIAGFAVPLRGEHVEFFKNILVPLLKVQSFSRFYN